MRRTASGSRLCVAGSMSANTGVMPCQYSACAVATKVHDGTITSPSSPSARMAISSAMVPLHMATQCFTPRYSAMRRLELLHHRAVVGQPLVVENAVDVLQKCVAVADIGPAHMQRFGERRWRAVDGEVGFAADGFHRHGRRFGQRHGLPQRVQQCSRSGSARAMPRSCFDRSRLRMSQRLAAAAFSARSCSSVAICASSRPSWFMRRRIRICCIASAFCPSCRSR